MAEIADLLNTIKTATAELEKKIAEQPKPSVFNEKERRVANDMASSLQDAFIWSKSPQGRQYWDTVYKNLRDIANGR